MPTSGADALVSKKEKHALLYLAYKSCFRARLLCKLLLYFLPLERLLSDSGRGIYCIIDINTQSLRARYQLPKTLTLWTNRATYCMLTTSTLPFSLSKSTVKPLQVYWRAERAKGNWALASSLILVLKFSPKMSSLGKKPKKHPNSSPPRSLPAMSSVDSRWRSERGVCVSGGGLETSASDLSVTGDVRVRGWLRGGVRKMEGKLIGLCPFISDTLPNPSWQASEERRRDWLQRQLRIIAKSTNIALP